ncbi:hypothetical protein [Opitutus terrae]|uniref:hypothetical protein n=1 Tax=Opitutus terrae TaxID=107709 RepID=UPI00031A83B8|nr:hypothetical protein [Opitutus terrae]
MSSPKKAVFSLVLLALVAMTAGCMSAPRDTSIPWSRPADWEGQIPGMGSGMGR